MKQQTLLLAVLAASSNAAPQSGRAKAWGQGLNVDSFALPEKCYFNGEKPSEAEESHAPKLSQMAAADDGDDEEFGDWVYAPPYLANQAKQIPILPTGPHFHALGDSYSAGPGAGEYYGEDGGQFGDDWCYRTNGSYAVQLIGNKEPRERFNLGAEDQFQFLSCTGHVTKDVVKYQIPELRHHAPESHMTVTLSIGGNDLGFSRVLKACLIGIDIAGINCELAKMNARNLIHNEDGKNTFRDSLWKVWSKLRNPKASHFPVVAHTLYPTFFNTQSANCNDVKILKVGYELTIELRKEINDLVREANEAIITHLDEFQKVNPFAKGRFFPIEVDDYYEGHRLCDPKVKNLPGFSDDEVWFFGVASSDSDGDKEDGADLESRGLAPRSNAPLLDEIDPETCDPDHKDMGHAWGCAMVQQNQTSQEDILVHLDKRLPQWLTKSFHPKTAGFSATVQAIMGQLPRDVSGAERARKRSLSGTPTNTLIERQDKPEGSDSTFDGTLPDDFPMPEVSYPINVAVSGMVPCTNQLEEVMGTLGEAHFVDIDEANVVLMYDGVAQIFEADDEDAAFDAWKELYDDLVEKVGGKAVILASNVLPPAGLPDNLKERFAKVNDRIINHLDGVPLEQYTIAIDLSQFVAGPNKSDADVSVEDLDDEAHVAILRAWMNGASHAAINYGWIKKYTSEDPKPEKIEPEVIIPSLMPELPTNVPTRVECVVSEAGSDCEYGAYPTSSIVAEPTRTI